MERLWKYLVLYIYGGVYVSLELVPTQQFANMDLKDRDAVIALQSEGNKAEKKLGSTFLMAPPRHPLLFFALHRTLQDLSQGRELGDELHKAFIDFSARDVSSGSIAAGMFSGADDRSVTVIDMDGGSQIVKQGEGNVIIEKKSHPQALGSCKEKILMEVLDAAKAV